jgi:hypothetical protein
MCDTAESDLLRHVANGDTDAFSEVYDWFAGAVFSLATRILPDGAFDFFVTLRCPGNRNGLFWRPHSLSRNPARRSGTQPSKLVTDAETEGHAAFVG